jgi:predicted RNase H-like nuclease
MKFIGVDGCKKGWFYICLEYNKSWSIGVLPKISELTELITESELILVDIPIGLWEDNKDERQCDLEARKVLKQRGSSVFPTPSRFAINCNIYEEGSKVNYAHTGRRLSHQSWAIARKINEMDILLGEIKTNTKIREFHPEVGFWALNKCVALQNNKKSHAGFNERLDLLKTIVVMLKILYRKLRKSIFEKM